MTKKASIAVLCCLLTLAAAAYAGGKGEAGEGRTKLTLWMNQAPAMNEAYAQLIEAYQKEHPEVDIEQATFEYDTYIQTLQTAFPSGTESDLIMMFGTWVKSYAERLSPVPASLITPTAAGDTFLKATLGGYLFDGQLYGIPQEFNIEYGALMLNTRMAREAGFDPAVRWKSWEEAIRDMKKTARFEGGAMTRAAVGFCHADGIAYTFLSLLKQFGGSPMNAVETAFSFDTPAGAKALALMKRLVNEKLTDPVLFNETENFASDAFFGETMAGAIIGPWVIADYAADFPEMVALTTYVPLPSIGATPEFIAASGWGLTVSKNSPHQDAAWDLVRYIALDPGNAMRWNVATATLPAISANTRKPAVDVLLGEYPYLATHVSLIPHGTYQGHMPDSDMVVYDILYNAIHTHLRGETTADETLRVIQEQSSGTLR